MLIFLAVILISPFTGLTGGPASTAAAQETVGGPLLASAGVVLPPGAPALPAHLTASGWLVADLDSGAVLAARNPHGRYLPASTLKTLTALTLLPRLTDRRRLVTASVADSDVDGTRVGLVPHGRYPVQMLFQCMLMMSGNDCADALAEANGGVPVTLTEMNDEARRLHADDTHAATPSGLDGPGQASSAYDLALILRQDLRTPDFRRYNTTRRGMVPAQRPKYRAYEFANDNKLLWNYPGVLAAKNGYTDAARHTFVAAVQTPTRQLLITMMHGEQTPIPIWRQVAELVAWGVRLPRTFAPVGELVQPGSPTGTPGSAAPAAGRVTAASAGGHGVPWLPLGIGVGVVGIATAIILARRREPSSR